MAHGEKEDKLLKWAVQCAFCLNPKSMPASIVITSLRVERFSIIFLQP